MSRPIRILWVEDDLDFSQIGCANLQNAAVKNGDEITVEVARTLSGGIIRASQFDCVFLDLELPDSPIEDTIVALPRLADSLPPIIVLSGFTYPDRSERGLYWDVLLRGAENVYFKPAILDTPHVIIDAVKKAILLRQRSKNHAT